MHGACSAYEGEEKRDIYRVWWGNLREKYHLEDPGVVGRIILRWIFRKWDVGGMDWIDTAQDRDSWRALVNAVMNLRVTINAENFSIS